MAFAGCTENVPKAGRSQPGRGNHLFATCALAALLLNACGAGFSALAEPRQALVVEHVSLMGSAFRLRSVRIFVDDELLTQRSGSDLPDRFEVFRGTLPPAASRLRVELTYRGNGYGVFSYISQYRFQVQATFLLGATTARRYLRIVGYEGGEGSLSDRPRIELLDCGTQGFPEPRPHRNSGCRELDQVPPAGVASTSGPVP